MDPMGYVFLLKEPFLVIVFTWFWNADTTDLQGVQFRHETAEEVIASDAENFFSMDERQP